MTRETWTSCLWRSLCQTQELFNTRSKKKWVEIIIKWISQFLHPLDPIQKFRMEYQQLFSKVNQIMGLLFQDVHGWSSAGNIFLEPNLLTVDFLFKYVTLVSNVHKVWIRLTSVWSENRWLRIVGISISSSITHRLCVTNPLIYFIKFGNMIACAIQSYFTFRWLLNVLFEIFGGSNMSCTVFFFLSLYIMVLS